MTGAIDEVFFILKKLSRTPLLQNHPWINEGAELQGSDPASFDAGCSKGATLGEGRQIPHQQTLFSPNKKVLKSSVTITNTAFKSCYPGKQLLLS